MLRSLALHLVIQGFVLVFAGYASANVGALLQRIENNNDVAKAQLLKWFSLTDEGSNELWTGGSAARSEAERAALGFDGPEILAALVSRASQGDQAAWNGLENILGDLRDSTRYLNTTSDLFLRDFSTSIKTNMTRALAEKFISLIGADSLRVPAAGAAGLAIFGTTENLKLVVDRFPDLRQPLETILLIETFSPSPFTRTRAEVGLAALAKTQSYSLERLHQISKQQVLPVYDEKSYQEHLTTFNHWIFQLEPTAHTYGLTKFLQLQSREFREKVEREYRAKTKLAADLFDYEDQFRTIEIATDAILFRAYNLVPHTIGTTTLHADFLLSRAEVMRFSLYSLVDLKNGSVRGEYAYPAGQRLEVGPANPWLFADVESHHIEKAVDQTLRHGSVMVAPFGDAATAKKYLKYHVLRSPLSNDVIVPAARALYSNLASAPPQVAIPEDFEERIFAFLNDPTSRKVSDSSHIAITSPFQLWALQALVLLDEEAGHAALLRALPVNSTEASSSDKDVIQSVVDILFRSVRPEIAWPSYLAWQRLLPSSSPYKGSLVIKPVCEKELSF